MDQLVRGSGGNLIEGTVPVLLLFSLALAGQAGQHSDWRQRL